MILCLLPISTGAVVLILTTVKFLKKFSFLLSVEPLRQLSHANTSAETYCAEKFADIYDPSPMLIAALTTVDLATLGLILPSPWPEMQPFQAESLQLDANNNFPT